ncbi:MAG: DinB family protein [Betaproteobacteria bacterium]|nr:MAG: DinB family protein [Betaproteobacteria bacterium]
MPVVARGGRFVYAQIIGDVVEFLGLAAQTGPQLSPDELARRLDSILAAAQRYARQMPADALERQLPERPRSYRVLLHHVFQIPAAFIDAMEGGALTYENMTAEPPADMRTPAAIAEFGATVRRRVAAWWTGLADRSGRQPVSTYYGVQPMHEVLERTAWHSAQHARQVMSLLEQQGIAPEGPLGPAELHGLPVPEKLWD